MPAISIMLKPASGLCNMQCKYCFYTDETTKRETASYGTMSLHTLEQIIKNALSYATDYCSILFQGGEPTLVGLDFYKAVIEFENKWNIHHVTIENSIQTNGLLIDEEWALFLHQNHFLVGLSLDGTQELHDHCRKDHHLNGTFSQVIHAVELFRKHHVEFNILTVVTKHTIPHTRELYTFFKENG